MELVELPENEVPTTVECPECHHKNQVDVDWQVGDIFTCPNCSAEIQVTGLNPLWVDFAPEEEEWDRSDESAPLSLEQVEEMEDEESEAVDEETGWDTTSGRPLTGLLPSRSRTEARAVVDADPFGQRTYLTPEGVERLQRELESLLQVRLPKVTAWLSDALADGFEDEDVTELEEARSELSFVEGRIRSIESLLRGAEMLEEPDTKDVVLLGSRVTVIEGDYEPETYRIVSPAEADPLNGFISNASPLGKALMGHQVGDRVMVQSPDGPTEFRIDAIL